MELQRVLYARQHFRARNSRDNEKRTKGSGGGGENEISRATARRVCVIFA